MSNSYVLAQKTIHHIHKQLIKLVPRFEPEGEYSSIEKTTLLNYLRTLETELILIKHAIVSPETVGSRWRQSE